MAVEGHIFKKIYVIHEELGKGRYGLVKRVVEKKSGKSFAAKFVGIRKISDQQQVREEMKIMNLLRHPKLLRLTAAFENPKEIVMVTEYISGGELFERVVADDFTLTEKDSILFMRQICEGVRYMHENNIVHLDLKPENIMCHTRTSHRIKLIDFGLAQILTPNKPVRVLFGTPEFISPEIINYEPIGTESDMWSVGVICYVLLTGLSPFMGDNDAETFANIVRADYDFEDEAFKAISLDAKDFMSNLLKKKKEIRMSAKQCLNHSWLTQLTENMSRVVLPTDKLKKFIVRRKWQKTGNALRALGRMVMLSAIRRSSLSPTSSRSFNKVISSEFSDTKYCHVDENIIRNPNKKFIEWSITDNEITKKKNEVLCTEEITENETKSSNTIKSNILGSNKESNSKKLNYNINMVLDEDNADVNFDASGSRQKKITYFHGIEIVNNKDDVASDILNSYISKNNQMSNDDEENLCAQERSSTDVEKLIASDKQLDPMRKKTIDMKTIDNNHILGECIKKNKFDLLNINYNDNKSETVKIENVLCSDDFQTIYEMKDNYSDKLPNSNSIQKRKILNGIDRFHFQDTINNDKLEIKQFYHKNTIIPTNLKKNEDIILDREITRHNYRKFNPHFKGNPNDDSRLEKLIKEGMFISTGNVSRTAELFEKLKIQQGADLQGSKIGVRPMTSDAATNSATFCDKPKSERIQRVFEFWKK